MIHFWIPKLVKSTRVSKVKCFLALTLTHFTLSQLVKSSSTTAHPSMYLCKFQFSKNKRLLSFQTLRLNSQEGVIFKPTKWSF